MYGRVERDLSGREGKKGNVKGVREVEECKGSVRGKRKM